MKISIKVLRGDECIVEVNENTTILEIKHNIDDKLNIPVSHQKLLQIGKTLADDKTVGFYSIKEGTKITLVVKKPDPLKDIIHKHFKKYYSEDQADRLTKEFMLDFDNKVKQFSLDDLERLAAGLLQQEGNVQND